jgi:hypothetical protein
MFAKRQIAIRYGIAELWKAPRVLDSDSAEVLLRYPEGDVT